MIGVIQYPMGTGVAGDRARAPRGHAAWNDAGYPGHPARCARGIAQPVLEACDIFHRGRSGVWRYDVSSQNQAARRGVKAVDFMLAGTPEHAVPGVMYIEPPEIRS